MSKKKEILTDDRYILEQDTFLPKCIICDIDGTLALINGRHVYDNKEVYKDKLNYQVARIVYFYKNIIGTDVVFMSGRMESSRDVTEEWLKSKQLWFDNQKLYMRKLNDYRDDAIVKKELYEEHIKEKYFVEFVLDDRNRVVSMWRTEGLLCLQVYYGDF